jgi:hypothetical protein
MLVRRDGVVRRFSDRGFGFPPVCSNNLRFLDYLNLSHSDLNTSHVPKNHPRT